MVELFSQVNYLLGYYGRYKTPMINMEIIEKDNTSLKL